MAAGSCVSKTQTATKRASPCDVEAIRSALCFRDRTLVSVLAYSGPRPEEVVRRLRWADISERAIR
jgi:hypothetical protein